MTGQQAGAAATAIRGGAVTLAEAADAFLSSPRVASPSTRRAYAGVPDRLAAELGPGRQLAPPCPAKRSPPRCAACGGGSARRRGIATGPPSCPG
jgi:hypothetical protein